MKPSSSMRDVAGPEPAVGGEPVREVGAVGVAPSAGVHLQLAGLGVGAHVDAGVGPTDGTELRVAELLRVSRTPPDDLAADLGLAVAVQHRDAELITEAPGLERRQRRRDAAHVLEGSSDVTRSSSHSIAIAAGGSTVERMPKRATSGELGGVEAVHDDHGRTHAAKSTW